MGAIDYIIVGLGNPEKKYDKTRHNAGFMMIECLSLKIGAIFNVNKFNSMCAFGDVGGKKILLLKPQTYMNLSGKAVFAAMSFYKIKPENVLVIFDDISLPVGKIRVRKKGSHGGQNGMRNIIDVCKSNNFPRVKIGIGKKPENWDLSNWVLSKFEKSELDIIQSISENVCSAVELIIQNKIDEAMNKFN